MENKEGRSATNYPIYEEDKYNYDKQRQIHNTMNHGYPLNNQQVMVCLYQINNCLIIL